MWVESKSGRQAILGKVFVDATGDGDIAALSGVPYEKGRKDIKKLMDFWKRHTLLYYLDGVFRRS
ncbi:MAG: FAD-dependent oxidoreductase [Candidatus Latescibacteria bacterium]|nr:FAD-dependent oxidoreductase [Candidatus Latescibacterota bacterium]